MTRRAFVSLSFVVACSSSKAPPQTPLAGAPAEAQPESPAQAPGPPPPAAPAGKPRNDLIPRSVLFGNPARANVQISPDGKHVAWLASKEGVLNVWVAPIDKLDQARAITSEATRPIWQYFWAYTSKHVVYLQDTAGDENFHFWRADLAGGRVTDLTPYKGARAELVATNPKFPTKLLISINDRDPQVFDLHEVDLLTTKRTMIAQNDDELIGFVVDRDNKPRLATKKLPDGATAIFAAARVGSKLAWRPWDTLPFEDAESSALLGFAPDGKTVYAVETRGRDTAALVAIDVATKRPTLIAEDVKADVGETMIHPAKHTVQAVAFDYERMRWHVIDKSIAKDFEALAELDGGDFFINSRALDDRTWLVTTTSDLHPRRYHVWDRRAQKATFLFAGNPEVEKQPLVKMHPVVIRSRDGLDLVSYLTLPRSADPDGDGRPSTPTPMVLSVHGGPWKRDQWGYSTAHQMYANRGYAVLSVNFRGSTGFGKKFLNAANLQWGKAMHDDLIDAVNWAVSSGVATRDRICISGESYGGYATLVGLAMTPDVFRCGVDLVGISSLLTFIASFPPYWAPYLAQVRKRVGDPDTVEGKALLSAASPLSHVARIKSPLLIGQGANDPRVKQAESEQIVAEMKKHKLPVIYALFPDEGHGFARPVNSIAFFALAEAFLSAHLGGYYLPITRRELDASSIQIEAGREHVPGLP